jgi:thymidylate synthase ThyX
MATSNGMNLTLTSMEKCKVETKQSTENFAIQGISICCTHVLVRIRDYTITLKLEMYSQRYDYTVLQGLT